MKIVCKDIASKLVTTTTHLYLFMQLLAAKKRNGGCQSSWLRRAYSQHWRFAAIKAVLVAVSGEVRILVNGYDGFDGD